MAAKTIFVVLYLDAVEGNDRFLRPDQVTKMTDSQAKATEPKVRLAWMRKSLVPGALRNVRG